MTDHDGKPTDGDWDLEKQGRPGGTVATASGAERWELSYAFFYGHHLGSLSGTIRWVFDMRHLTATVDTRGLTLDTD